jgi:hypothetical protein
MEKPTNNEQWDYLLLNGQSSYIKIKDPKYNGIELEEFESIEPLKFKNEKNEEVKPSVEQVQIEKRNIYREFFKKPFKNLLILTGAGSSIGVGGKSMYQLWDIAERNYFVEEKDSKIINSDFQTLCSEIRFDYATKNLEALLSQIEGCIRFSEDKEIQFKEGKLKLSEIRKQIFETIRIACTITTSPENTPHKKFLEKVLQRKQTSPRVKIFTLNYDTLFENAAQSSNAIIIDGFSYTMPRTFSGRYFDYDIVQREGSKLKEDDNFIQRVFHLHKLHGSINWETDIISGEVVINSETKDPLMVYPRDAKYEDSYEQPFFEMMARFQRSLRQNNDTLLTCIGYSFNDKHINSAIEEALNQNPGFRLAVIDPGINSGNSKMLELKSHAMSSNRILMVSETFSDFVDNYPEIQTYNDLPLDNVNLSK